MATKNIVPRVDGEGGIGTASKRWGSGHFDSVATDGPVTGKNYKTIYVDAGAMVPTVTNGASAGTEELATNDVMMDYFAFDKSSGA